MLNKKSGSTSWLPEIRVNRMDLEDRRIHRETPKIRCHDKKNKRKGSIYHWNKSKGKNMKCSDKGTMEIQKPAQINPLMTVLMSSRPPAEINRLTYDETCAERLPLTSYGTVVLELPENLQYKPAVKKSSPARKLTIRKCIVPDPNKLKLNLRW